MMRKLCVWIWIMATLLTIHAYAESPSHQMMVANCDEWAALREKTDSSSNTVAKVPYGSIVDVYEDDGVFAYCCYDGVFGYILDNYLAEIYLGFRWDRTDTDGCNTFIQQVNETVGYELLNNLRVEPDDYIDGRTKTVADISGTNDATINIFESYFSIDADIDDLHNVALQEVYVNAGQYFVTDDRALIEEMYSSLIKEFETEYQRHFDQERVYVEHTDMIGRYICYLNSPEYEEIGLAGISLFMGELQ